MQRGVAFAHTNEKKMSPEEIEALHEFDPMEAIREFDTDAVAAAAAAAATATDAAFDVAGAVAAIIAAEPADAIEVLSPQREVPPQPSSSDAIVAFNRSMDEFFEKSDESFKTSILNMIGTQIQGLVTRTNTTFLTGLNSACTQVTDHVDRRFDEQLQRIQAVRAEVKSINGSVSSGQKAEAVELFAVLVRHFELAACVLEAGKRVKKPTLQQIMNDVANCDALMVQRKRHAVVLVSLQSLLAVAQLLTPELHANREYTLEIVKNTLVDIGFRAVPKPLASGKGEFHEVRDVPFLMRTQRNVVLFTTANERADEIGTARTAKGRKRTEPKVEYMQIQLGVFYDMFNESAAKLDQFSINTDRLYTDASRDMFKRFQAYLRGEDYTVAVAGDGDGDDADSDEASSDAGVTTKKKRRAPKSLVATSSRAASRKRHKAADPMFSSSDEDNGEDASASEPEPEPESEPDAAPASPLPVECVEFARFFLFKHLSATFAVAVSSARDPITRQRADNVLSWKDFVAKRPMSIATKLYVNPRAFETLVAYLTKTDRARGYREQADLRLLDFMTSVQRTTNIPDAVKGHLFIEETYEKTLETLEFNVQDVDDMLVCSGIAFYDWYNALAEKYKSSASHPAAVFARSFIDMKQTIVEKYNAQQREVKAAFERAIEKQKQRMRPVAAKFPAAALPAGNSGRCQKRLMREKMLSDVEE